MIWLYEKYIGLLSSRLELFRRVRSATYNFRCPICGDSTKNTHKARGYLFQKDKSSSFLFHCHNCGTTRDFDKFIKELDPRLYDEYLKELLIEKYGSRTRKDVSEPTVKMEPPKFNRTGILSKLNKISTLPDDHNAVRYVKERSIPIKYHSKLFHAPNFGEFMLHLNDDSFVSMNEERLIIPFFDENKECFGFQGRDLNGTSSLRYITILIDESKPKIFGLDTCDFTKQHFVLEGPIDSMFVENSIAMAGGSIDWSLLNENSVLVYDNEPRSRETCKKIEKAIDKGVSVVIFPNDVHAKDINDMFCDGYDIMPLLQNNVSRGLASKLKFKSWSKVK